jgi:hypothetical protein
MFVKRLVKVFDYNRLGTHPAHHGADSVKRFVASGTAPDSVNDLEKRNAGRTTLYRRWHRRQKMADEAILLQSANETDDGPLIRPPSNYHPVAFFGLLKFVKKLPNFAVNFFIELIVL